MAVRTLQNLVLRGVTVGRDGLAIQARLGAGYQGNRRTPVPFSMRHPSSSDPQAEKEPDQRHVSADHRDDVAAGRAGRPGRLAGVLGCRRLAMSASRAIAFRWSPKSRPWTLARKTKRAEVGLAWFTPASGAFTASTRGKEA